MIHGFDVELAKRYGQEEAVIIQSLQFWITKNRANGKHSYEGRTWTYNSARAWAEVFPYWSEKQIRRILKSLEDQKVVLLSRHNVSGYDRTLWYAFQDESMFLDGNIHFPEREVRSPETVTPIPLTLPDSSPVAVEELFPMVPEGTVRRPRGGAARPPLPVVKPDFDEMVWVGDLGGTVDRWQEVYPDIDVRGEMFKAIEYARDHPEKHYTKWYSYLSGWMRRTQGYAEKRGKGVARLA